MIASPLRSATSKSLPGSTTTAEENTSILGTGSNRNDENTNRSSSSNGDLPVPSTPLRYGMGQVGNGNNNNTKLSPLKAAASLIQSLDMAHTEMTSFAADAAVDAERARRNARTALEIARRYQNRSYPVFHKSEALEMPTTTSANESVASSTATTPSSSPFFSISRPERPQIRRYDEISPNKKSVPNDFEEEKTEAEVFKEDGNEENRNNGEDNDVDVDVGLRVNVNIPVTTKYTTPMSEKDSSFRSPTSYERIAQHHADDVLQLTLELEQTRQALELERRSHKECQVSLASARSKKKKLEKINQNLLEKHEMEQKESMTQISNLEKELELSGLKVQAAEEDAQLALDLAKDSSEQRDKIEESLLRAEKEIKTLREQLHGKLSLTAIETPKRNVHFADQDANTLTDSVKLTEETPPKALTASRENGPPRSMIAAGRQLLLQRTMSPQDVIIRLQLSPTRSAERRKQLYRRLNGDLDESSNKAANGTLFSSSPSRTPYSPTPGIATASPGETNSFSSINGIDTKKTLKEYHTAVKILQISGKRLDLDGSWWSDKDNAIPFHDPIQIDVMARQYCQNVEFKIVRQQKDINQLESLCGYLEKKLFLDNGTNGN